MAKEFEKVFARKKRRASPAQTVQKYDSKRRPLGFDRQRPSWIPVQLDLISFGPSSASFQVPRFTKLPSLPTNYFFKGGVAREALRLLHFPSAQPFELRDLDVMRFASTSDSQDHLISRTVMADDYRFGRGVEVVESIESYFKTRDIVVNQCLFRMSTSKLGELHCSKSAFIQMQAKTLSPCAHVQNGSGETEARTVLKILRLTAEALCSNFDYNFQVGALQSEPLPYDFAITLDRCLESGPQVAEEFLTLCWEHSLWPKPSATPPKLGQAVMYLASTLGVKLNAFKALHRTIHR